MAGGVTVGPAPLSAVAPVFGLGIFSLWDATMVNEVSPWFIASWFYFAAGVLCYWHLLGRLKGRVFWTFVGAFIVAFWVHPSIRPAVGLVTVFALYGVGRAGRLTRWLGGPVMTYLGRTSYSLYLIHLPVILVILPAGYKITGEDPRAAVLWLLLAAAASFGAAHLLYLLVEAPSMRLAARWKSGPRARVVPAPSVSVSGLALKA